MRPRVGVVADADYGQGQDGTPDDVSPASACLRIGPFPAHIGLPVVRRLIFAAVPRFPNRPELSGCDPQVESLETLIASDSQP